MLTSRAIICSPPRYECFYLWMNPIRKEKWKEMRGKQDLVGATLHLICTRAVSVYNAMTQCLGLAGLEPCKCLHFEPCNPINFGSSCQ